MTNEKLHQFNLRNNDLCEECLVCEDIIHLLCECPVASEIWDNLQRWLTGITNQIYHFDNKSIILGNKENGLLINTLIMLTKHELYNKK